MRKCLLGSDVALEILGHMSLPSALSLSLPLVSGDESMQISQLPRTISAAKASSASQS